MDEEWRPVVGYPAYSVSSHRAVWGVVQQHTPDKTEGQCREIVKTWIKTGLLKVVEYQSPTRRATARGLAVDSSKRPS